MAVDGTSPASGTPHPSDRGKEKGLSLLVVDDDLLVARTLCLVLRGDGHEVVHAGGGREGIEVFQARSAEGAAFDAVMTDLQMPGMDGWQVAARVKELDPTIPVILLTGDPGAKPTTGGGMAHVDIVLGKPPRLQVLRDALAACRRRGG